MRIKFAFVFVMSFFACVFSASAFGEPVVSTYRSVGFSLPLSVIGNEAAAKLEYNLFGEASISADFVYAAKAQEFSDEKVKEEKTSLTTQGYEAALGFSRFSKPFTMSGFYWTLAAGYRKLTAVWLRKPSETYQLTGREEYDEDGRLTHELYSTGMTGRGRLGYRYSAQTLPFIIGAYFGLRHFENKFYDVESEDNPKTTDEEREKLKKIVMTRPEGGIELGLSF